MNPKGPSLVDLETAEPVSTRRSLIGAVAAAGVIGAATAVFGSTTASAATPEPPNKPTDSDTERLDAAMRLELAASALYELANANLSGDDAVLARVMKESHEAYAGAIAGTIGVSATGRNDDVFDALEDAFSTSDEQEFARAARDLENTAAATHNALLGEYDSVDALELTVSIIVAQVRAATVFTSMAGSGSDLDELLGSDAEPLDLTGGAA